MMQPMNQAFVVMLIAVMMTVCNAATTYTGCAPSPSSIDPLKFQYVFLGLQNGHMSHQIEIEIQLPTNAAFIRNWIVRITFKEAHCLTGAWPNVQIQQRNPVTATSFTFFGPLNLRATSGYKVRFGFTTYRRYLFTPSIPTFVLLSVNLAKSVNRLDQYYPLDISAFCRDCDGALTSGGIGGTSCSTFTQCSNGTPYKMSCAPGTEFNPSSKVCDFPRNSGCRSPAKRRDWIAFTQTPPADQFSYAVKLGDSCNGR